VKTDLLATPESSPTTISVVIVEDVPSLRDILASWIQNTEGFTLLGAFPDGESAISGMLTLKPEVALVDINLPGINGIECVRQLKPQLEHTQFVMLTMYQDSNNIFDALSAGATGYLIKTTPRDELIAALKEVKEGGSPMSSNIARKVVLKFQQATPQDKVADALSKREHEVLALLAQGYLIKEIADKIGISAMTVNTYNRRIYEKLHVHSRSQAAAVYASLQARRG
jgi:DNA-binding NarL/FixJ family response regulator